MYYASFGFFKTDDAYSSPPVQDNLDQHVDVTDSRLQVRLFSLMFYHLNGLIYRFRSCATCMVEAAIII